MVLIGSRYFAKELEIFLAMPGVNTDNFSTLTSRDRRLQSVPWACSFYTAA